jgi:hypothetical protein
MLDLLGASPDAGLSSLIDRDSPRSRAVRQIWNVVSCGEVMRATWREAECYAARELCSAFTIVCATAEMDSG